jgi:hypothetical protein
MWSKVEIRGARKAPLPSLLPRLGYRLRKLEHGNFRVDGVGLGAVVVKECFWFDKETGKGGNAIDFLTVVEKKSFAEAMEILCPKKGGRVRV